MRIDYQAVVNSLRDVGSEVRGALAYLVHLEGNVCVTGQREHVVVAFLLDCDVKVVVGLILWIERGDIDCFPAHFVGDGIEIAYEVIRVSGNHAS